MALTRFGFIVTGSQLDARVVMRSPSFEMIAIGISTPDQGPAAALELVREGVQLLELCGGFGPVHTARVIAAVGPALPVGAVGYGPESLAALHRLFAP
jgi:hypothetical protein